MKGIIRIKKNNINKRKIFDKNNFINIKMYTYK